MQATGTNRPLVWQHRLVANASGKGKTRQTIKTQTMRELMFASGGRCAMTDCGLSLISPTGGWIGTVAHIIGAELDGPRGAGPMTPEERASFDNLILMCATHGREVDAPETGEKNFPIDKLRIMKETHEAKVSEAVAVAIEQELSGVQTATGAIDTALRSATAAATAEGLRESLVLSEDDAGAVLAALADAQAQLQRLSQPALDTLSQLLGLWLLQCRNDRDGSCDFGDGTQPSLPCQNVDNRIMRGMQGSVDRAMDELKSHEVILIWADEYEGTADYVFGRIGNSQTLRYNFNFWRSAAEFLYAGHGVEIQDWIKGLDFSIFDRIAPADRDVPWR
jgi:hypothetical protein